MLSQERMQGESKSISELCQGSLEEAFKNPREIGYYSVDAQKEFRYDRSQMKYYVPRENEGLFLDLNVSYEETSRDSYDSLKSFHSFLKVIADSHFDALDSVNFVTSRGAIQKLLCTPHCSRDKYDWMMCARRVGKVIYLTPIETDATLEREAKVTEKDKKMSAWGYRFEAYMTADRPNGVPDTTSTTHEREKYVTVFTNNIGSYNLLMSAEVDAVNALNFTRRLRNGDPSCYIELKTYSMSQDFRSNYNFKKYKSHQWWAQSVIVGIEDTFCGMRDNKGIVHFIENFRTEDLPFLYQEFWNHKVCFNFCNNFLEYVKKKVKNPRIVYKFEYNGGPTVIASTVRDDPEEKFQVIPKWYLAALKESRNG